MTPIELENRLQEWGLAIHIGSSGDVSGTRGYCSNPIAASMRYAPGTRSEVIRYRTNMERSGSTRRQLMGVNPDPEGSSITIPTWACEPVRGKGTHHAARTSEPWFKPDIERLHKAIMALYRVDNLRGICICCEYQLRWMTKAEKAVQVSKATGTRIGVRQVAEELKVAKFGILMRLAA